MKARAGALTALIAGLASASSGKDGPVTKVVDLLTALKARIEADDTDEQAVYDKYACWCETTTASKAASITEARETLTELGNTILQYKGAIAIGIAEIKELTSEVAKNEKAQAMLTKVRTEENAAFEAEREELQQTIAALEQAVTIIKGATTFVQKGNSGGAHVRGSGLVQVHDASGQDAVAAATKIAVQFAVAASERLPEAARPSAERNLAVLSQEASKTNYAPQSATIQGILTDMYASFATTLETSTHEEGVKQRNFEDLIATYQAQLNTLRETLTKKERKKAEDETILADATQDYATTEDVLKADVEFFDATKKACEAKTESWSTRRPLRGEELDGINQALEIRTSDASKELFAKAIKPGFEFLQVSSNSDSAQRNKAINNAFELLQSQARKAGSLKLAAIAAAVSEEQDERGVGHFDKVLEAIDTMIGTLKDEEKADIEQNDECLDKIQQITSTKGDLKWKIEKNGAKIEKLGNTISAKEAEKGEAEKELETVEKDIEDSKAQRAEGNAKFLAGKEDDEKAIDLLQSAMEALKAFYEKNGISFVGMHEEPAPEAKFSDKGNRKTETKGVTSFLEVIIEDLHHEVANAVKAEEENQLNHEAQVAAAEQVVKDLVSKITDLEGTIADTTEQQKDEETLKGENEASLGTEEQTEADIKPDCDWIKENIKPRATKRAAEVEGLVGAKQYLAGMRP
jgi:hypothetical protein